MLIFETLKLTDNGSWFRFVSLIADNDLFRYHQWYLIDEICDMTIFITSSLQLSQISLDFSGMPSARTLFRQDLSSSSVNFSGSKRSFSISLRSVWTFLISFLAPAKPSWSYPRVKSGPLVMSTTFCEMLSRRSLVLVSWDLMIFLTFSWWSSNSSLTIFLIVSIKPSLVSSVAGVVGVVAAACRALNEIFGLKFTS